MLKTSSKLMIAALSLGIFLIAQAPTGTISGYVTDESGAVIPNATVTITNKATGFARTATTNAEGFYSAPALPAGDYEVRAETKGFKTLVRAATVEAGESDAGQHADVAWAGPKKWCTVEAATAQINYESHNVQGVIDQIQHPGPAAERPQLPATGAARAGRDDRARERWHSSTLCSR